MRFAVIVGQLMTTAIYRYNNYICSYIDNGAEKLNNLVDNWDYKEIIDVLTIIAMSIIHILYKKSHQKLHFQIFLMLNVTSKLSQVKVCRSMHDIASC